MPQEKLDDSDDTEILTVRIPRALKLRLQAAAPAPRCNSKRYGMSQLVRDAIEAYLETAADLARLR